MLYERATQCGGGALPLRGQGMMAKKLWRKLMATGACAPTAATSGLGYAADHVMNQERLIHERV